LSFVPVRKRPVAVVTVVLAAFALAAGLPGVASGAPGAPDLERLAERLLKRDPAARLGGESQVATAPGAVLRGRPGRVNFMFALGDRQRLIGGNGHDELGAYHGTRGVRIWGGRGPDLIHGLRGDQRLHGGPGNDEIYGGAGDDVIYGGAGRDRIIDNGGRTVVITGPGRDRVDLADGDGGDRVVCEPGQVDRIVADGGDALHPRCGEVAREAPAAGAAQSVSGNGSNKDPFTAACSTPQAVECTITDFVSRSLTGLWANEFVPAYKCSDSHPYLLNQEYAPFGTALPAGVEIDGLGPIGISITAVSQVVKRGRASGTQTGTGVSSATNWNFGTQSYRVKLHCTSDSGRGYFP
jgi:RTX calcium-binding nonapeptide repeat (4 copies)